MQFFPLHKCRRILRNGYKLFKKKGHLLTESEKYSFEKDLRSLDQAILAKRKDDAVSLAKKIESFIKVHFPKTFLDHTVEILGALAFAIVVAFAIRQFWFELYEVPTGSMRPTIMEKDRMVVTKTTFGINMPFKMKPLLYSDEYLKRAGIIVFTVENMDVADSDMLYFYLFPGKKRYIKRGIAKPGDTIYFYGGKIYGIDKAGNPIEEFASDHFLKEQGISKIDHIPFISFDGKMITSNLLARYLYGSTTIKQMNEPVAKLEFDPSDKKIHGRFFDGSQWVEDRPSALKASHDHPVSYSDLWGIGNFAMARILTKKDAVDFYGDLKEGEDAQLYLELHHTPNLTYPKPEIRKDDHGKFHPLITPMVALIPLKQSHLEAIQKALITARFVVKDGRAYRYQEGRKRPQPREFDPLFPNVPNGTYEFYYGKGYKVHFGGIRTELEPHHPLYSSNPENVKKLFNLGIHFNILFEPLSANQPFVPQRFAYYRDGDLYLMGEPVLKKNDPTLMRFVQQQQEKQGSSSREEPYIAFIDKGAPLKNGKLDIDFIKAFGLKVPENGVVALGDNYAMSADSRDFGFVPTENLRGTPSFIFWPPSQRLGALPQPFYPWFTLPNILVWSAVAIVIVCLFVYLQKRNKRSIFKD